MKNIFDSLKTARWIAMQKRREQEDRISGGYNRILEAILSNDFSDFSNVEKEAYMIFSTYTDVIFAIQEAEKKLKQAIELENELNVKEVK